VTVLRSLRHTSSIFVQSWRTLPKERGEVSPWIRPCSLSVAQNIVQECDWVALITDTFLSICQDGHAAPHSFRSTLFLLPHCARGEIAKRCQRDAKSLCSVCASGGLGLGKSSSELGDSASEGMFKSQEAKCFVVTSVLWFLPIAFNLQAATRMAIESRFQTLQNRAQSCNTAALSQCVLACPLTHRW
jgi:hypothetical protein